MRMYICVGFVHWIRISVKCSTRRGERVDIPQFFFSYLLAYKFASPVSRSSEPTLIHEKFSQLAFEGIDHGTTCLNGLLKAKATAYSRR